jgi:hypothetical protein
MRHAQGPVPITAIGGSVAATVAWRARAVLRVTVVVKATFALLPDAPMTLLAPDPIEPDEAEGDPGYGLRAAGDLAPYLGQTDVLLAGHAHAAPGASSVTARFAIVRDEETLIEKALELAVPPGALLSSRGAGTPATLRIPLAGMSPLSKHWPVRKRLLQGLDPRSLEAPIAEIPEPFDWNYFQAAPLDQRIEALQGNEWVLLGCMHPGLAEFGSRLPGARGVARLYGRAPGLRGRAIPLTEDTLCIDVDRQRCSVLFRGHFPVSSEQEFASLHIVAGVELPGRALSWVDPFPQAGAAARPSQPGLPSPPSRPSQPPSAPAPAVPFPKAPVPAAPSSPLEGTMALSREDAERLWAAQAKSSNAPAVARVPSAPASKLGPGSPPAPMPPPPRPEAPSRLEGTVAWSDDNPLLGTMALSDADAARLKAAQATPFTPLGPSAVARVPSVPGSRPGPGAPPAPPPAPFSTAPQTAPSANALGPEASNPLFGTMELSDADAKRLATAQATPFTPSTTPAVARVPCAPASKLGPGPLPASMAAPPPAAPQATPHASPSSPWAAAPSPLEGTMAWSEEDAAKLMAGKPTPFGAQGAPLPPPPPPPPRSSQPASHWTEREVPQAAYVPPARISRPPDEPAVASFSAPQPLPIPPPPLSAPAAETGSEEPPRTLGENFLEAMADAGEGSA